MVTKRLGKSKKSIPEPVEEVQSSRVVDNILADKSHKFNNFEDQLNQIRLSRDYLENNPNIAQ